jgi:hypothetical protein
LRFKVARYADPKTFRPWRQDGHGGWVQGLDGVALVPYNLPLILQSDLSVAVYFPEGEKDADTLTAAGLIATTTQGGADGWAKSAPATLDALRGRHLVILSDLDDAGDRYRDARVAALVDVSASVRVVTLPGLEHRPSHGEDVSDWLTTDGHSIAELEQLAAQAPDATPAWDDPISLPDALLPVAPFDAVLLPAPIRGWADDCAERMQVPLDFLAAAVMVVAGSLIGRRVGIYPKEYDDWLVVANLWGALVGRPSVMKSAAEAEVLKPLGRLMAEAVEVHKVAMAQYEVDLIAAEARKGALKDDIKGAAKKDRGKLLRLVKKGELQPEDEPAQPPTAQIDDLTAQLAAFEMPERPTLRRFKTSDATIEKLGELLIENPAGLLVESDELSSWLRGLDKQGRESDRAFYLESWEGTKAKEVDRIGRGCSTCLVSASASWAPSSQGRSRATSTTRATVGRAMTGSCSASNCWYGLTLLRPGAMSIAGPTRTPRIGPTTSSRAWRTGSHPSASRT